MDKDIPAGSKPTQPLGLASTERLGVMPRKPLTWQEEADIIRAAQERRIEEALTALLNGDDEWWRTLDSSDFTFRLECGAVLARLVKAIRAGLAP